MRGHHRPSTPGAGFFEAIVGGDRPGAGQRGGRPGGHPAGPRRPRQRPTRRSPTGCCTSPTPRASRRSPRCGPGRRRTRWPAACGGSTCSAPGCTPTRSRRPREFDAGRAHAQVARVVAGVADPPGPDELRRMVDEVLRGIAERRLRRRAVPGRRVRAGGGHRPGRPSRRARTGRARSETARMLTLAEQLEAAGHLELARSAGLTAYPGRPGSTPGRGSPGSRSAASSGHAP